MNDDEYNSLGLRASICPNLERWPTDTTHWAALVRAGGEMRAIVSKGLKEIAAVDADKRLSTEGKRTKKREIATQTLDALKAPASLAKAQEAVAAQMQKWADKISANVKPAADQSEAVLHAQIREKVGGMKEGRLTFLQKHGADPTIAAALLLAPPFLADLSESELTLLRSEVEAAFLSPEIIAARKRTCDALQEVERGLRAAQAMIRKSAPTGIAAAPARVA